MERCQIQKTSVETQLDSHFMTNTRKSTMTRNPSLAAKVESAYVRWRIFGQKEMCDMYLTYVDTGASAKTSEEARIVMRSAGVIALDRTRTIYPVDFEPSDWYKYLLPT